MIRLGRNPERLVLRSGPATVVLDKHAGKATLDRKHLPWAREPVERPLSLISGTRVSTNIDASSQAEFCSITLVMREGDGWVLSAEDKQHATAAATTVRGVWCGGFERKLPALLSAWDHPMDRPDLRQRGYVLHTLSASVAREVRRYNA